jgi:hypothetical protein
MPVAYSRTGHGAASVIPHLRDVIPLEPSHLCEEASPKEDATGDDESLALVHGGPPA